MYRLLLVDDESVVLQSMRDSIPWHSHNISLIGTCTDGMKALEVIRRESPDIVMTDIKMPVMSGLELVRAAHRLGSHAEFIVFSGYDEFALAKEAMKEGVKHYLLKPCEEDEVLDSLAKAIQDLEKRQSLELTATGHRRMESRMWRQNILLSLHGGTPALWEELNSDGASRIYWLSLPPSMGVPNAVAVRRELEEAAAQLDVEILLVLLINGTAGAFTLSGKPLKGWNHTGVRLDRVPFHANVVEFVQTHCGSYHAFYVADGEVWRYNPANLMFSDESVKVAQERLERLIGEGQYGALHEMLTDLFRQEDNPFGITVCMRLCMKKLYTGEAGLAQANAIFNTLQEPSHPSIADFLVEQLRELAPNPAAKSNFVDLIIQYINTHIGDTRLSLGWVANELVYLSEDHVGKMFARQTGETFISYLTRQRIERAKLLLSAMEKDKIYLVAQQVGYGDNPRYFSKVFKKVTGYTPKEYQRLATQKE